MRPITVLLLLLSTAATCLPAVATPTIYVDHAASGAADGSTWADAFTDLQTALGAATSGDEIWIAAGTYRPHASDASVSFVIPDGVTLRGGFVGGETSVSQADPVANETILSGDLAGDNRPATFQEGLYDDNSHHVVTLAVGAEATLWGLIIQYGGKDEFVSGATDADYGGGIFLSDADLLLLDCVLRWNGAHFGGAIFARRATLQLDNCRILANDARSRTAGIEIGDASSLTIDLCVFDNQAPVGGGQGFGAALTIDDTVSTIRDTEIRNFTDSTAAAIQYRDTGPDAEGHALRRCTIADNQCSSFWAAVSVVGDLEVIVDRCLFTGNYTDNLPEFADISAGAIYLQDAAKMYLSNSLITGNRATAGAAAIGCGEELGILRVRNCTIVGNRDDAGSNPAISLSGWTIPAAGEVAIGGSIIWDNLIGSTAIVTTEMFDYVLVTDSVIQGGHAGGTDILDLDPDFFIDGMWSGEEFSAGDYYLWQDSPAIDLDDLPSPPFLDYLGRPRSVGLANDAGAFEWGYHRQVTLTVTGSSDSVSIVHVGSGRNVPTTSPDTAVMTSLNATSDDLFEFSGMVSITVAQ